MPSTVMIVFAACKSELNADYPANILHMLDCSVFVQIVCHDVFKSVEVQRVR